MRINEVMVREHTHALCLLAKEQGKGFRVRTCLFLTMITPMSFILQADESRKYLQYQL